LTKASRVRETVVAGKQLGLDEDTINDYAWRLGYLERFFGRFRIGEISPQLVDRFRDELHEQAETIRKAQQRALTDKGRRPLMETVPTSAGGPTNGGGGRSRTPRLTR
jgi:hypothetical protein